MSGFSFLYKKESWHLWGQLSCRETTPAGALFEACLSLAGLTLSQASGCRLGPQTSSLNSGAPFQGAAFCSCTSILFNPLGVLIGLLRTEQKLALEIETIRKKLLFEFSARFRLCDLGQVTQCL